MRICEFDYRLEQIIDANVGLVLPENCHFAGVLNCENRWVKQSTRHEAAMATCRMVCRINASDSRKWGEPFNPKSSCAR